MQMLYTLYQMLLTFLSTVADTWETGTWETRDQTVGRQPVICIPPVLQLQSRDTKWKDIWGDRWLQNIARHRRDDQLCALHPNTGSSCAVAEAKQWNFWSVTWPQNTSSNFAASGALDSGNQCQLEAKHDCKTIPLQFQYVLLLHLFPDKKGVQSEKNGWISEIWWATAWSLAPKWI